MQNIKIHPLLAANLSQCNFSAWQKIEKFARNSSCKTIIMRFLSWAEKQQWLEKASQWLKKNSAWGLR